MRKLPKKLLTIITAAVMSAGALSLAACAPSFEPLDGIPSGEVSSNGGFVVEKGDYVYFINGVQSATSDNTYGSVVKGALMRASKKDVAAGKNGAQIVVPSLIVSEDYTSGIYIYGDRVYYATPSTARDLSGDIMNDYIDFKSAKLDGSDVQNYFNLSDSAANFRFVEKGSAVYLVYENDDDLHSYNTATKEDVLLAADVTGYAFDSKDVTNPTVYYTMNVTQGIDIENGSVVRKYNQIYRVDADATEGKYTYTFDEDYVKEHDGEVPYTNLGEIVFDGIGMMYTEIPTQFTEVTGHLSGTTPIPSAGYSYTLQSYQNGGIYFTRSELASTSSVGEDGWLYYLNESKLGSGWNSISGNAVSNLNVVAQNTDRANSSALFYIENGAHRFLYVENGNMFRAEVSESTSTGNISVSHETTLIARNVTDANLISLDDSDANYKYVYYTISGGSGTTINRAVYNGSAEDYSLLGYGENEAYRAMQILEVEQANSWYNFEIIDGILYYADAESIGSTSYNYISTVNLNGANGVMNNAELKEFNELYAEIMGGDDTGYIDEVAKDYATLATAIRYYFYLGTDNLFYDAAKDLDDYHFELDNDGYLTYETTLFHSNIEFAVKEGNKKDTYLYSDETKELFKNYVEGKGDSAEFVKDGKSYRTRSYFISRIGAMNEADAESMASYWQGALEHYTLPEEEDEGLPAWAWALIGIGIAIVVIAIAGVVFVLIRKNKNGETEEEEKLYVDTTDDRDVDVYAENAAENSVAPEEEPIDETVAEEPSEESATEEASEEPAEEPDDAE